MTYERIESPAGPRPLTGCALALAVAGLLVAGAWVLLVFLGSGPQGGELVLEDAEHYGPGSLEAVKGRGLFVVRTGDGTFVALASRDPTPLGGRATTCPVELASVTEAEVAAVLRDARPSPAARGATVVFRAPCSGAVFDITGVRLSGEGRNLDRFPVSTRRDGRLVVDLSDRQCSRLREDDYYAAVPCP